MGWRAITGAVLLLLAAGMFAAAQELFINLEADGDLDALFQGLDILATITGDIVLVGDVPSGEGTVGFTAEGSAYGIGIRHILTLLTKGWILLTALGQTVAGDSIFIRSLIYAARQTLIPLKADELVEGFHHTVIEIGEFVDVYWGELVGFLTGGLAPAVVAGTIRLTGVADLHFRGEKAHVGNPSVFPETIRLDDPDVPDELLQAIATRFGLRGTPMSCVP